MPCPGAHSPEFSEKKHLGTWKHSLLLWCFAIVGWEYCGIWKKQLLLFLWCCTISKIRPYQSNAVLAEKKRTIHGTRCVFSPAIAEVVEFFDASFSWDEVSAPMAGQPNGPYHGTGYDFIVFCLVVWNMNFIFPNSWDDDPIWRSHIFQGGRYTTN